MFLHSRLIHEESPLSDRFGLPLGGLNQNAAGSSVCETAVCKFRFLKSDLPAVAQRESDSVTLRLIIEENRNTNLQWL